MSGLQWAGEINVEPCPKLAELLSKIASMSPFCSMYSMDNDDVVIVVVIVVVIIALVLIALVLILIYLMLNY